MARKQFRLTVVGTVVEDPLLSTDPAVLDSGSQIINKLETASAKLKTLPTAKTTSVAAPENKDLHKELASQADGVLNLQIQSWFLMTELETFTDRFKIVILRLR